jgi:hypothetical protein
VADLDAGNVGEGVEGPGLPVERHAEVAGPGFLLSRDGADGSEQEHDGHTRGVLHKASCTGSLDPHDLTPTPIGNGQGALRG